MPFTHKRNPWLSQDAIRSVSKEGRHLLSSLEASGTEEDSHWDVKLDWDTVQRYSTSSKPQGYMCGLGLLGRCQALGRIWKGEGNVYNIYTLYIRHIMPYIEGV